MKKTYEITVFVETEENIAEAIHEDIINMRSMDGLIGSICVESNDTPYQELPTGKTVAVHVDGLLNADTEQQKTLYSEVENSNLVKALKEQRNVVIIVPSEVEFNILSPSEGDIVNVHFKLPGVRQDHRLKFMETCAQQIKSVIPNHDIVLTQDDEIVTINLELENG